MMAHRSSWGPGPIAPVPDRTGMRGNFTQPSEGVTDQPGSMPCSAVQHVIMRYTVQHNHGTVLKCRLCSLVSLYEVDYERRNYCRVLAFASFTHSSRHVYLPAKPTAAWIIMQYLSTTTRNLVPVPASSTAFLYVRFNVDSKALHDLLLLTVSFEWDECSNQ